MFAWLKKAWWLAVIVAAIILIIGWQKKRCDAQEQKCRANYAAQEARSYGFSIDGNAAEQEAINAACESNGEFCRLFSSANIPTWLLVLVGFGGIWAALATLGFIRRQIDLQDKEFVATHRPKLVIREVRMLPKTTNPNVTISYIVSNTGSGQAQIVESIIEVQRDETGVIRQLPKTKQGFNEWGNNVHTLFPIEAGTFIECTHYSKVTHQSFINQIYRANAPALPRLLFRGRLIYEDRNKTRRQMAFCRCYDFRSARFLGLGDPDYEYED